MDWIKLSLSAITGAAATFFDQYGLILGLVLGAVVVDCVTGLVKAKTSKLGWDSKKASRGFWKKIALLAAMALGVLLDLFVPTALAAVGVIIPFNLPFALVIGCYITLNECISVCENLYIINPSIVPGWVVSLLKVAKKDIENKADNSKKEE